MDGAIHRAAGPELREECWKLGGCPTGEARITKGYDLPAAFVIHTVGPVWRDGNHGEPEQLAACYRNSLALAVKNRCRTVAFPSISTGAYGYPVDKACRIAIHEVLTFIARYDQLEQVTFVCFSAHDRATYDAALEAALKE